MFAIYWFDQSPHLCKLCFILPPLVGNWHNGNTELRMHWDYNRKPNNYVTIFWNRSFEQKWFPFSVNWVPLLPRWLLNHTCLLSNFKLTCTSPKPTSLPPQTFWGHFNNSGNITNRYSVVLSWSSWILFFRRKTLDNLQIHIMLTLERAHGAPFCSMHSF